MASSYSFPPLEVLSFTEPYGKMYIGFWFQEEELKKANFAKMQDFLKNWTIEIAEEVGELLYSSMAFVHIEHKRLIYRLNHATMKAYINDELNFQAFIGKYLAFLSHKERYKLQDILDSNFYQFLIFLAESKKTEQVLTSQAKSLEKYIDFDAYENLKKAKALKEKTLEIDVFQDEESCFSLETLPEDEEYSWYKFYITEGNFPLFEGNENNYRIQKAVSNLTSSEGSLPANIIEKFWSLYRKEQDFLDFVEFTLKCQTKIMELRL